MADTSHWTLQDFANAAGKRQEPYPTCAAPAPERICLGCGADLSGLAVKSTGLPKIFCGDACRNRVQRRWRDSPDETAALSLHRYTWD